MYAVSWFSKYKNVYFTNVLIDILIKTSLFPFMGFSIIVLLFLSYFIE